MAKPKKGPVQKLRLFDGDLEIAHQIAANTKLDLVTVLSLSCSAGLQAIKENDYQFPMPMRLEVAKSCETGCDNPEPETHDPPRKRKAG